MSPLERDAAPSNYPAFYAPPAISSEIYPALFDWFFASEEFQCWYQGGSNWQLRCIGGPGSGKVFCCPSTRNDACAQLAPQPSSPFFALMTNRRHSLP